MWSAGTHQEHTLIQLKHHACIRSMLLVDQAHARAQTIVSEPQTHMRARGIHRK